MHRGPYSLLSLASGKTEIWEKESLGCQLSQVSNMNCFALIFLSITFLRGEWREKERERERD